MKIPWYVHVIFAVCCYCGFKFGIPALLYDDNMPIKMEKLLATLAPISAILFLLTAATALYSGDKKPDEEEQEGDDIDER